MYLKKETQLKTGNKLIAYWTNNKGRGDNNCTLYVVTNETVRAGCCKEQEKLNYLSMCTTCSWRGDVNLSVKVCSFLGINKLDLIIE